MDTRRTNNTAASPAMGLSSPAAPVRASSPVHSSKLKFLRRYVTDTASRIFVDDHYAKCRSQEPKDGDRAPRRRWVGSSAATSEDTYKKRKDLRNVLGVCLLHDALGEAEAPPPRVATGVGGASGMPSSSRRRAAACFDALEFGRVLHQQAGANVKAYSLVAEGGRLLENQDAPSNSGTDDDSYGKDGRLSDAMDSDDEGVVVVDDMGRSLRVGDAQQREIKALLKAEENALQQSVTRDIGQTPADTLSAAMETDIQKVLITGDAVIFPDVTKNDTSFLEEANQRKSDATLGLGLERTTRTSSFDEARKCGKHRDSEKAQSIFGGEQGFGISEQREDAGGVGRQHRQDDPMKTAEDTDLSPPRRLCDKRPTQSRGDADAHRGATCGSSSSCASGESTTLPFSSDDGGYGADSAGALPSACRVYRAHVTQSSRPPNVLLLETSAAARVIGTGPVGSAHPASPPCSGGFHELSTAILTGDAASGRVKRCGEGGIRSQKVAYRDRCGRIITEDEWLELKDPATRRRLENRKKERPPPVELAWGGGLVQQAEKAHTTAEEAILGQKPLARYELDEDFDLTLQRKERWGDPLAEVPAHRHTPQAEPSPSPTVEADAEPGAVTRRKLNRTADRPRCPFDAPKNRFGIQPGYRWDGVVRGNGYEDRRLKAINRRNFEERQKHMDNVADM